MLTEITIGYDSNQTSVLYDEQAPKFPALHHFLARREVIVWSDHDGVFAHVSADYHFGLLSRDGGCRCLLSLPASGRSLLRSRLSWGSHGENRASSQPDDLFSHAANERMKKP